MKKKTSAARHVRLYHWVMDTDAWKSLDPLARALYVAIARRYCGNNNGRIGLSVRDAAKELNTGKSAVGKAFDRLAQRGFVIAVQKGAFGWKARRATEWRLTEHPCDVTSTAATQEFRDWQPTVISFPQATDRARPHVLKLRGRSGKS